MLFVADDNTLDNGYISNGWTLTVSTGIPVESDADLEMGMTAAPAGITLSNILVYTISVTNSGPAVATNVLITDTLPAGAAYVSSGCNCAIGTNDLTGGVLTFTTNTLAVGSNVTFTITVIPDAVGYITNLAVASSDEPDPNVNNAQTNVTFVGAPSADMGVTLSGVPNPVMDGANVTYTVVAINNGPSTATGVMVTNNLPAAFVLMTNQTHLSQGTVTNLNSVISWNVGTLGSGSSATMTIVAGVGLGNTLPSSTSLDSVTVSSAVYDPAKLNNFASIKTEVLPAMLTLMPSGANFMLSWPNMSGNVILEGSVKLPPTWVPINSSSVIPQVIGGQNLNTYVLPGSGGYHFFRLISQLP